MYNEIQRKITSLTLMAIMVAGGMTFAVPGMMPTAHAANANLFVSAENSQFDNYMSGPQVIEVVVIDSDINDTDESKGQPDVTVNGKILRMTQAVDGNWYGYFADRDQAQIADSTVDVKGSGLDFGTFCDSDTTVTDDDTNTVLGKVTFTDTDGIALNHANVGINGTGTLAACGDLSHSSTTSVDPANNVVREAKDLNTNGAVDIGQIGMDTGYYPIIQLYQLNPTGNVVVQYNKGGGVQSTTLTFDTVSAFAGVDLDRTSYPRLSQVHATITDLWLNIDPTDEDSWTFGTNATDDGSGTYYQVFDENGGIASVNSTNIVDSLGSLMCEENCKLDIDTNLQSSTYPVLTIQDNGDSEIVKISPAADDDDANVFFVNGSSGLGINSVPVTFTEQGPNSGVFGSYDESDKSALKITADAARGTSASIDYNETPRSIIVGFDKATINIDLGDDKWNSGEEIPVFVTDGDQNKNSRVDEDLDLNNPDVTVIPSLSTGDPFTLGEGDDTLAVATFEDTIISGSTTISKDLHGFGFSDVDPFSQRLIIETNSTSKVKSVLVDLETTVAELHSSIHDSRDNSVTGFNLFNYDVRSFSGSGDVFVYLYANTHIINNTDDTPFFGGVAVELVSDGASQDYLSIDSLNADLFDTLDSDQQIGLVFEFENLVDADKRHPIVADFFSFGFLDDGVQSTERFANQIIRIEAEESGDNTSTFKGSLEYVMVNQLNINDPKTYSSISTIADDPSFIVIEDLTDEDAPRVSYNDVGSDGVVTPVSDQEEAPSHAGVVSFDKDSYKNADTVVITLEDADLNVDSDLEEIYTVVSLSNSTDPDNDQVGKDATGDLENLSFGSLGRLLDVTFDDQKWQKVNGCDTADGVPDGLGATGFSLVETSKDSGIFVGSFQIPAEWCRVDSSTPETATGLDIEVNYVDFRDASGEIIEVGDSAGVRANTGSISLDRTVYPVPFGVPSDFDDSRANSPDGRSLFPIHQTGLDSTAGLDDGEYLVNGDLTVHIRVNDPDFDVNPNGEDSIAQNVFGSDLGPVKVSVLRGSSTIVLGYAGGPTASDGLILVGDEPSTNQESLVRQFGPLDEIAPDAGIYELDLTLKFTDGPASTQCPNNVNYEGLDNLTDGSIDSRFLDADDDSEDFCILQGDILQVEYTDPSDASGDENTVTDSATFDLRNGVLQTDKSVYIIGSDMILTLIEPDFDLDNDQAETYDLDIIEWDSDAATTTMGDSGVDGAAAAFDPEPTDFRETGDSTGIFQIVIEVPEELDNDRLERGEEIILEYTDWGPSGSDYVGDEDEDVNLTVFTSNFGATVELDQKVYTWTDKVYITIVAPDHNFDSDLVDEIGDTELDPLKVSTRGSDLDLYKLVETGTDTGIFTGEVILTGFTHNADGDSTTGDENGNDVVSGEPFGNGPTNGLLPADDDDGLTVSFEFSEDETVVGSALIRWNIGEVQWLEASYPASGTGVVRVIDPDMNLDPEAVDNFAVDVWSDSDAGGIDLTVTETNEATGIFEGTVFFTVADESSGHRLRVAEGDTVTAEYEDNTLPDPYTTADELDVTATSLIGTVVPPLERAPVTNLRTVDAFGNTLDKVTVDQQVQISADIANGQDREQAFAYLVQIQDVNGVTIKLDWIIGSLTAGQSFSPAGSWIPAQEGEYNVTVFVWESVDNPTALSPPVSTTVNVS